MTACDSWQLLSEADRQPGAAAVTCAVSSVRGWGLAVGQAGHYSCDNAAAQPPSSPARLLIHQSEWPDHNSVLTSETLRAWV